MNGSSVSDEDRIGIYEARLELSKVVKNVNLTRKVRFHLHQLLRKPPDDNNVDIITKIILDNVSTTQEDYLLLEERLGKIEASMA